jgi:hypothetical protein
MDGCSNSLNLFRLFADNLRLDGNNLTGSFPPQLCASFNFEVSTYYADCLELDCPCCNFCCTDGVDQCTCPFQESEPILCIP